MRVIATITAIATLFAVVSCSPGITQLKTLNQKEFEGEVTGFDFASKTVTIQLAGIGGQSNINTSDLDYRSKRKLLFSPAFHGSYPSTGFWIKEKWILLALAILSPIALLVTGMWLAGLFIARRFNPFSAVAAFLGSWVAGAILIACYLVFAAKSNLGAGLIWVGVIISILIMALFVSAMYRTSFIKGIFIFVAHLFFAGLLAFLAVFGADTLLPSDRVSEFWESYVFRPTGLVEGPREGY